MKITCDRLMLCDALANVSRAVSSKAALPALEGILLKAHGGNLSLSGYDLELGITTSLPASIEEEGELILNARLFSDMARKISGETLSLSSDEKLLTVVRSGAAEFTILGMPASDFPELPSVDSDLSFTLSGAAMKSMIEQTLFAVAVTDTKPAHTGSLFEMDEEAGVITVVSVDGFRLAMRKEKAEVTQNASFIVPGKTLSEITKLLKDDDKFVSISLSKKHIVFSIAGYTVISRLLDGDFLDYKNAIPKTNSSTVTVSVREMVESIERVSLLITDRLKSPVRCDFAENEVKLSSATTIGKATDSFPCETEGNSVEIGFNNKYLLDALKACQSDQVRLQLSGPLAPMKIVPMDGDSFLFLVLPVRLKNEN